MKRVLRRVAAGTVGGLRLSRPIARALGGRAAVLAYHRVLDPKQHDVEAIEPGMHVTRDAFAAHLALLQARYRVVPLMELTRALLTGEPIPHGTVALTFDDGWLDTYEVAYPLLRAAGLPATVFVPTAYIGSPRRLWYVRAMEATHRLWTNRELAAATFPDDEMPDDAAPVMDLLVNKPPRPQWLSVVSEMLKPLNDDAREAAIAFIEGLTDTPATHRPDLCDWEQLRRMNQDVFEIGSHTVNHVILTQVSEEQVKFELDESRRVIAAEIGKAPLSFCYPNGNFDEGIARLVGRTGYACAPTTEHALIGRRANLYALPRLGMHQDVAGTANGLALLLSGIR